MYSYLQSSEKCDATTNAMQRNAKDTKQRYKAKKQYELTEYYDNKCDNHKLAHLVTLPKWKYIYWHTRSAAVTTSFHWGASMDDTAQLWNLGNGQPIGSTLRHANNVTCVSFSIDGTLLATGGDDYNAYTWDIAPIIEHAGLKELLVSCSFSSFSIN